MSFTEKKASKTLKAKKKNPACRPSQIPFAPRNIGPVMDILGGRWKKRGPTELSPQTLQRIGGFWCEFIAISKPDVSSFTKILLYPAGLKTLLTKTMILIRIYNQQFQGRRINYLFYGLWLPGYIVGGKKWLANHHTTKLTSDIWQKKCITLSTIFKSPPCFKSTWITPILLRFAEFETCPIPCSNMFTTILQSLRFTKYLSPQPLSKENPHGISSQLSPSPPVFSSRFPRNF